MNSLNPIAEMREIDIRFNSKILFHSGYEGLQNITSKPSKATHVPEHHRLSIHMAQRMRLYLTVLFRSLSHTFT